MFSTLTATNDSNPLGDGPYIFDQSHNDLLPLSMSHESMHLKSGLVPISGLNELVYGRESTTPSIHYADIHDALEIGRSASNTLVGGNAADYIPSPLDMTFAPQSATKPAVNTSLECLDINSNGNISLGTNIASSLQDPSTESIFVARTPQSLSRGSQLSSTPELLQSSEKAERPRSKKANAANEKSSKFRASSSIPPNISWPEFGRQCILAAESSRLNPFTMHPAEYKLLREHINRSQVTIYLSIRNAVLRLWHRNPLVYVSLEEAMGCARDKRFFGLAKIAYLWLLRNGYINFGCVEVPCTANTVARTKSHFKARRTILVVGAGMSGLGCARHLEGLFAQLRNQLVEVGEHPPKIIVLEARPRVGGRVYSHPFINQSDSSLPPGYRCTAEMGAQIVTGFEHGNPMNAIIRGQLGLPCHGLRDNTILYDYDGTVVERSQDALVEKLYNDVLERAAVYRNKPAVQKTIDGDRNLILAGREPSDSGGPCIADLEQPDISLSTHERVSVKEEKPAASVEKLTGRAYQLSAGFDSGLTAAEAAQGMGWKLKSSGLASYTLNLGAIAKTSDHPSLGQIMDEGFRQYQNLIEMKPRDMRLLNWHHANLEYANAVSVNQLSLSGWDQDIGNEFEGEHTEVVGGYQQVPRGLWQCPSRLDVRFNTPIKAVHYNTEEKRSGKAVRVECINGEMFEADQIVLTASLGVLKSGSITFQPPLPEWKREVIDRMGYGLLNKIILVYEKAFWEPDRDMFGLLNEAEGEGSMGPEDYSSKRGRFYLFWNCMKTSGKPVLVALLAGEAAHYAESTSNDQLIKEVTDRLDSMFAPNPVPLPSETIVTRWKRDPFARGSYSYVGPRTQAGDYDIMARPHGPLHFAGEATCGTHPATVHGAYLSGLRVAAEVLESIIGPIQIPNPLVEKKVVKVEHFPPPHPPPPPPPRLEARQKLGSAAPQARENKRTQRDEEYEAAIIGAILQQLGERPIKPGRTGTNPFLLYTKDCWHACKNEMDDMRKAATGNPRAKASKQEIRNAIGRRWRTASPTTKQPYLDQASHARDDILASVADFQERATFWDEEAARIRREYTEQHPPASGHDDLASSCTAIELGAGKRMRTL